MLIAAFICFILAITAALITYKSKQLTLVLIAKILFHVFLLFFIALLFIYLFEWLPPPTRDASLPL